MSEPSTHRSLSRALDILELCATCPSGFTLSQLSQRLQAPKSSLFPLVHTLQKRGYLINNAETGRYYIGSMTYHVGNHYLAGDTIMTEIEHVMQQVVDSCHVTCFLGSLKGGDVFYIKRVLPEGYQLPLASEGRTLPAYSTGLGKALLMDHTLPMLRTLYYDGLYSLTPQTITDFHTLFTQLTQMRAEGISHEEEESTPSVRCFAVPIRKQGVIVAALSAAFPTSEYRYELKQEIHLSLERAKDQIEHLIRDVDIVF